MLPLTVKHLKTWCAVSRICQYVNKLFLLRVNPPGKGAYIFISREERVFDDSLGLFFYFSMKPYVVPSHLSRLIETVQMKGHNICF